MSALVYCPRCGGPGKVVRDWRGDETTECDAYDPCRPQTPLDLLTERAEDWPIGAWMDRLVDAGAA